MTAVKYMGKIRWHENVCGLYVHQTQKPEDLKRCCGGRENASLKFSPVGSGLDCDPEVCQWDQHCVSAEATLPRCCFYW